MNNDFIVRAKQYSYIITHQPSGRVIVTSAFVDQYLRFFYEYITEDNGGTALVSLPLVTYDRPKTRAQWLVDPTIPKATLEVMDNYYLNHLLPFYFKLSESPEAHERGLEAARLAGQPNSKMLQTLGRFTHAVHWPGRQRVAVYNATSIDGNTIKLKATMSRTPGPMIFNPLIPDLTQEYMEMPGWTLQDEMMFPDMFNNLAWHKRQSVDYLSRRASRLNLLSLPDIGSTGDPLDIALGKLYSHLTARERYADSLPFVKSGTRNAFQVQRDALDNVTIEGTVVLRSREQDVAILTIQLSNGLLIYQRVFSPAFELFKAAKNYRDTGKLIPTDFDFPRYWTYPSGVTGRLNLENIPIRFIIRKTNETDFFCTLGDEAMLEFGTRYE